MPPEPLRPDDPREWLKRARSNLARAKARIPDVYLEDLCFDAQQVAEKSLKAVLIHRGLEFPYSHDLSRLLTLLDNTGKKVPKDVRQVARLTRFAVDTRYPGLSSPVSEREYQTALRLADVATLGYSADRRKQVTRLRKAD